MEQDILSPSRGAGPGAGGMAGSPAAPGAERWVNGAVSLASAGSVLALCPWRSSKASVEQWDAASPPAGSARAGRRPLRHCQALAGGFSR